jgi:predicted nucleic acid-binding protein
VARSEARRLNLPVSGTLGVIARAYREALLSADQAEPLVREIAARPDIWIADALCEQLLDALNLSGPEETGR